jgi:undecaprenyl diphosphate synthase
MRVNARTLVPSGEPPLHIAILPDGGRRWAKINGVTLTDSYDRSAKKLQAIVTSLFDSHCDHVSVCLSGYNNHKLRSAAEVACINTFVKAFTEHCSEQSQITGAYNLRIDAPKEIARSAGIIPEYLEALNTLGKTRTLALFVGYHPLLEINDALQQSVRNNGAAERFVDYLWASRPVDLVVRTGGYKVLSGFLPLVTSYSRLYFLDELFNDVSVAAFQSIVSEFLGVPRHYGE